MTINGQGVMIRLISPSNCHAIIVRDYQSVYICIYVLTCIQYAKLINLNTKLLGVSFGLYSVLNLQKLLNFLCIFLAPYCTQYCSISDETASTFFSFIFKIGASLAVKLGITSREMPVLNPGRVVIMTKCVIYLDYVVFELNP